MIHMSPSPWVFLITLFFHCFIWLPGVFAISIWSELVYRSFFRRLFWTSWPTFRSNLVFVYRRFGQIWSILQLGVKRSCVIILGRSLVSVIHILAYHFFLFCFWPHRTYFISMSSSSLSTTIGFASRDPPPFKVSRICTRTSTMNILKTFAGSHEGGGALLTRDRNRISWVSPIGDWVKP